MRPAVLLVATLLPAAAAEAAPPEHQESPYAGLESREMKALSAEDVAAYRQGRGMELALPAELNGYPGPRHVLELAAELGLTAAQQARTEQVFAGMRAAAIAAGEAIVEEERRLDRLFAERRIDEERLASLTAGIARLQGELRAIHLRAHLEMTGVLTAAQRQRYQALRGYGDHGAHQHPEG